MADSEMSGGIAASIPGMHPGKTVRNVLIACGYLMILPFAPLILAFLVAINWKGVADRLADSPLGAIPTIEKGGWQAGATVFVITIILFGVMAGALPAGESPTDTEADLDSSDDNGKSGSENAGGDDGSQEDAGGSTEEGTESGANEESDSPPDDSSAESPTTPTTASDENEEGPSLAYDDTIVNGQSVVAVSTDGRLVATGTHDGSLVLYDSSGDRSRADLGSDWYPESILLPGGDVAITDHVDGFTAMSTGGDSLWSYEMQDLWWVDSTPGGDRVAAISVPPEGGPGTLALVESGSEQWTTELENANGFHLAISDSGEYIAVGGENWLGDDGMEGQNSVQLYDANGDLAWKHDTEEAVISVAILEDENLVLAGTDDNRLLAFNLEGELQWERDDRGGYISASEDGSTIVTSQFDSLIAMNPDGEDVWEHETDVSAGWPDHIHVSENGETVLVADNVNNEVLVVQDGEAHWREAYPEGAVVGALSSDGETWAVVSDPNEREELTVIEVYD